MARRYKDTESTIYFGSYPDFAPYQSFSNFAETPFIWKGDKYTSLERAYHAEKTDVPKEKREIRFAKSSAEAKRLGRKCTMRKDWEDRKRTVMKDLVRAKFTQNDELKKQLIETKGKTLVEEAPWDEYWGNGKAGNGKNELGLILMEVRQELIDRFQPAKENEDGRKME